MTTPTMMAMSLYFLASVLSTLSTVTEVKELLSIENPAKEDPDPKAEFKALTTAAC